MTKKYKQMDKPFQIYNARRIFQLEIDYFAEIDSTLFFPENYKMLKYKFGGM